MQTKISFTVIATLFVAITSLNADIIADKNDEVRLSEESYVNDVSFDTGEIVSRLDGDQDDKTTDHDVQLQEEEYVNDININTHRVVLNHLITIWQKAKYFAQDTGNIIEALSEKGYIDKNNTDPSGLNRDRTKHKSHEVKLEEEPYVDDVPFDTSEIVKITP